MFSFLRNSCLRSQSGFDLAVLKTAHFFVCSVSIFSNVNVCENFVRSQGLGEEQRAYLQFLVVDENAVYVSRRPFLANVVDTGLILRWTS